MYEDTYNPKMGRPCLAKGTAVAGNLAEKPLPSNQLETLAFLSNVHRSHIASIREMMESLQHRLFGTFSDPRPDSVGVEQTTAAMSPLPYTVSNFRDTAEQLEQLRGDFARLIDNL